MSLRDSEAPFVPMASAPKPPRPWREMLETWRTLFGSLCLVLGGPEEQGLVRHFCMWRWMWSLPPCSEARKAVFTLGAAAYWIERWRSCISEVPFQPDDGFPVCIGYMIGTDDGRTALQTSEENARTLPEAQAIGQRAEAALRIAALHVDDARGEANAHKLGHGPTIPPYERVYSRPATGDGAIFVGPPTGEQRLLVIDASRAADLARAILGDYAGRPPSGGRRRSAADHVKPFAELAIASLPNGPWLATGVDVQRFIDLIEE